LARFSLARFMQVELTALRAIGLDRKARPVPTLAEYIEARAGAGAADAEERP